MAQQLLARHGVVTPEGVTTENLPGGFSTVYPVLKTLEESGRIRRGYFVAGLGATQFALPGAVDLLRSLRTAPDEVEVAVLSATDPANPYGATLKWPRQSSVSSRQSSVRSRRSAVTVTRSTVDENRQSIAVATGSSRGPTRTVGATVILVDGALAAYLARGDRQLLAFLPENEPDRSRVGRAIARVLIDRARERIGPDEAPRGMLIEEIDGDPPDPHPLAPYLIDAGFIAGAMGFRPSLSRT
jgi:ATP-dependent Lhr-like helicase